MRFEVFPKIYRADKTQCVNVKLNEDYVKGETVYIKIQPMEHYTVEHTPLYRIDEEYRYEFFEATKRSDGVYSLEYKFTGEQKYNVKIKIGENIVNSPRYIYSAADDLLALKPLKADTHLHTSGSDGKETPFEVCINYRREGYDFIAITDHHKMYPSVEAKECFEALTREFFVVRAEEVHNKSMGYFHIINLGGNISVNEIIEAGDGYAEAEVERHLSENKYPEGTTPYICAYRNFVSEMIRRGGGVAVMAHPFWSCYGEYNMPLEDVKYLLSSGCYDALELLAGCDNNGNGNNLQIALWQELLYDGVRIPVLGASDAHSSTENDPLFNKQFSIVFAKSNDEVLGAIKDFRSVAVEIKSDNTFSVHGSLRLVKYARFLLDEYYPEYVKLTAEHAAALEVGDQKSIMEIEEKIAEYRAHIFS